MPSTGVFPGQHGRAQRFATQKGIVAAFVLLLAANLLVNNATISVWDQDEAAYAGFAADMLRQNHWIVPAFPYSQPHRKVPLTFWLIAGSYALLGVNEFALRLPSVVATATTVASVWLGARFLVGRATAQLAAMILGSCLLVMNLGKFALTDAVLLACETIAALALLRGAVRPSWRATVTLWVATALALLAKGPPILVLLAGMCVLLWLCYPRRRNLIHLHPWFGLPLAAVPLAVWLCFAWQQDPRYVLFLGYWHVVRRVGGSVFGQSGPPGTYLLLFFVCLVPWTGYLLGSLADAWKGVRMRRMVSVLLGGWLFGGWVVWELLPSKLPTYTLGAFPALALLLARQVRLNVAGSVAWTTHKSLRAGFAVLVGVCSALAVALLGAAVWLGSGWSRWLAILPAGTLVLTALCAQRLQQRAQPRTAVNTLFLGFLAANLLVWLVIIPSVEERRSVSSRLARTIADQCVRDTTVVVAAGAASPSLPFYIEQAGLCFRDVARAEQERAPLHVDLSPLWRLHFDDLVRQVRAQNPREGSDEEERRIRLERVATMYSSGEPCAFVLDEAQYAGLRDQLVNACVIRFEGWQSDRFRSVSYTVVLTPSARR